MSKLHNVLDLTVGLPESPLAALDEQITAEEHEFFKRHGKLIRMLCALPPDQLLGLSLGALSGATRRRAALTMCAPAQQAAPEQSIESESLQAWLFRALSSSEDPQNLVRGLAAFRIGQERGQDPIGEARDGEAENVADRLLTSVVSTIEDAVEYAWCVRDQDSLAGPPEVEALRASMLDNEDLEGFVELTAGYASIRRIDCVGQLAKREPPYALIRIHRIFDLRDGGVAELCSASDNPTIVILREDLVQGLQTVCVGEHIRLRLESGLAGRVLAPDEVGGRSRSSGTETLDRNRGARN